MSLSHNLVLARERLGYRQEEVATNLGVSRAMVSYWEGGKRQPNDRQLSALARLYRVEAGSLATGDGLETHQELTTMLFRGAEADLPAGARPGIEDFKIFLEAYAELAKVLGVELHGMQQSPFRPVKGQVSLEDVRRKAEEVRAHLRAGLGPIPDVDSICEMLGITVYRAGLGSDLRETISGGFFAHPRVGFSLVVNVEMTPGRQRFTVAHELAHALFHSSARTTFVLSGMTKDPQEKFADSFAGEFLMPTEGIRRVMEEHGIGPGVSDPADAIHLQRYFDVSFATALVRLRQGKFLTHERYQEFKAVRPVVFARALGYEIGEEEYDQDLQSWRVRRFPGRFLRLLRLAVRSGAVSPTTAAGLARLTLDEVEELVTDRASSGGQDGKEFSEFEVTGVGA